MWGERLVNISSDPLGGRRPPCQQGTPHEMGGSGCGQGEQPPHRESRSTLGAGEGARTWERGVVSDSKSSSILHRQRRCLPCSPGQRTEAETSMKVPRSGLTKEGPCEALMNAMIPMVTVVNTSRVFF